MKFASGSAVFMVEGVVFKIPKALLQKGDSAFSAFLAGKPARSPNGTPLFETQHSDGSDDGQEAGEIVLDDEVATFRDWIAVLYNPHDSFLDVAHPANKDLGRLLNLLVFFHKYLLTHLKSRVLATIAPLVTSDNLPSNLSKHVSVFRVIQVSHATARPEIATAARNILLADVWSQKQEAYYALDFAEGLNEKQIIGAAYYQLLSARLPGRVCDQRLTPRHCQDIDTGMKRCAAKWQDIMDSWGKLAEKGEALEHPSHWCTLETRWLQEIWKELAKSNLQFYDVVGKLEVCIRVAGTHKCWVKGKESMERDRDQMKETMYSFFVNSG